MKKEGVKDSNEATYKIEPKEGENGQQPDHSNGTDNSINISSSDQSPSNKRKQTSTNPLDSVDQNSDSNKSPLQQSYPTEEASEFSNTNRPPSTIQLESVDQNNETNNSPLQQCNPVGDASEFSNTSRPPSTIQFDLADQTNETNNSPLQQCNQMEETSDIGDEYEESENESHENEPFIATVYSCEACGWTPNMEKCSVHRSFQTGFSNGVYQYQGIMPSQIHGYSNYTHYGYVEGQRPVYPSNPQQNMLNMQYNPVTNQVRAVPSGENNQTIESLMTTVQKMRRRTFCLTILVILFGFAVVTLSILMS